VEPLMAWKKIDDDQALPDMPYSSFLANGLTTNANSYNEDMTRGGGIAWNATEAVTWSSYWEPRGFTFTVDVGQAVKQVDFRVTYATLTASADADGFQGYVTIFRWLGREFVTVGLLPTNGTVSYLDISLPLNAAATGPQTFFLTFQSSILADLGTVNVSGGVQNQIFLDEMLSQYAITQGEKHEILDLTGVPAPSAGEANTLNLYQMNYISTGAPNPPDGYASVYPSLVANPPRLQSTYGYVQSHVATVYELGAMTLLGVAFNSVDANPGTAPSQLSHATTGQLSAVIGTQTAARYLFQPDLCNGVSQRYAFGAVVASATTSPVNAAVETGFSFVSNTIVDYLTLSVTLRYFGLISGLNPKLVLSLKDDTGTLVTPNIETPLNGSRTTWPQSVIGMTARGWYDPTAAAAWGMRDSMDVLELPSATVVAINTPDLYLLPNKVYTVELSVSPEDTAIYVFNLYARLTSNVG
jgi:hypothetical protein